MLLITIFVELRVVAGRSRTRAGSPQAVFRRPCCAVALNGMASLNHTRPHCANQMGKTHSEPLAARHGRGTTWARHVMCESTLTRHFQNKSLVRFRYTSPFCKLFPEMNYDRLRVKKCGSGQRPGMGWTVRESKSGMGEIFRICPNRPRKPTQHLIQWGSFQGVKWPGCGVDHPSPSKD